MTQQEMIAAKVRGALTLEDAVVVLKKHVADTTLAAECLGDVLTALTSAREGYEIIGDTISIKLINSMTGALTDIKALLERNGAA